jgi:general secretion pathway protein H
VRPKTWSAGSRGAAGFSLLELLAVLLIAGLLLAVVPPLVSRAVPGVQLKSVTRTLVGALRHSRSLAISRAKPAGLAVDLDAREVVVPGRTRPIPIPDQVDIEVTVAQSQMPSAAVAGIAFFPDGSSTGGRITLSRDRVRYRIDVDWLTGKVAVLD